MIVDGDPNPQSSIGMMEKYLLGKVIDLVYHMPHLPLEQEIWSLQEITRLAD